MTKLIRHKGGASTIHIQSMQYIHVLENKNTGIKNYKKMKKMCMSFYILTNANIAFYNPIYSQKQYKYKNAIYRAYNIPQKIKIPEIEQQLQKIKK